MICRYWNNVARYAAERALVDVFDERLGMVTAICHMRPYNLFTLREDLASSQCSDYRDRLYGVLSLLPPAQASGIVPRYDISTAELYHQVTAHEIGRRRDLRILSQCDLRPSPLVHLPSWVLDWSVDPMHSLISLQSPVCAAAQLSFTDSGARIDQGTLWASGLHLAEVYSVQDPWEAAHTQSFAHWVRHLWRQILAMPTVTKCYRWKEVLVRFCETLCCGRFRHKLVPDDVTYSDLQFSIKLLEDLVAVSEDQSTVVDGSRDPHTTRHCQLEQIRIVGFQSLPQTLFHRH